MTARKPTALKVLEGTARKDRVRPDEPQPPALELGDRAPAWIKGPRARRAWHDLAPLLREQGLLTVLDAPALGLLVEAFGDYLEARDVVEGRRCGMCGASMRSPRPCRSGDGHDPGSRYYTTKTETGSVMIRSHPAAAELDGAWRRYTKLLLEFGATPAARSRVSAAAPATAADPAAEFLDALG